MTQTIKPPVAELSVADQLREKVISLPAEKQRQILEYAERLECETAQPPRNPLHNPEGLWANKGINISEEDIAEMRREAWGEYVTGGRPKAEESDPAER